jgi:hypothetical protein
VRPARLVRHSTLRETGSIEPSGFLVAVEGRTARPVPALGRRIGGEVADGGRPRDWRDRALRRRLFQARGR